MAFPQQPQLRLLGGMKPHQSYQHFFRQPAGRAPDHLPQKVVGHHGLPVRHQQFPRRHAEHIGDGHQPVQVHLRLPALQAAIGAARHAQRLGQVGLAEPLLQAQGTDI